MSRVPVSIVVPVYGVQQYIDKCVESILDQKFSDIEVILVDDESPDGCPEICDDYAKKDKRVKVIHKKNGGLSDARNAGLEVATGKYIAFIDGDDYVSPDFIQILYDACMASGAAISCCSYYRVYDDGRHVAPRRRAEREELTNIEALRDIFTIGTSCEVMTWNKLYETKLFKDNKIRFPVGKIHEDNFTTYKLFYFANEVVFINKPLYYYIQRSDSIMGQKFDERRLHKLEAVDQAKVFMAQYNNALAEELESYEVLALLDLITSYTLSGVKEPHIKHILATRLKKNRSSLKNRLVSRKHKLMLILANIGFVPYKVVRKVFDMLSERKGAI